MAESGAGPQDRKGDSGSAGVLRRKIGAAMPQSTGPETAARAWRIGLARAARDQVALALETITLRDDRMSLAELLDLPLDRAFCAVLEGPQNGLGLLVFSAEVLAALIEMQTLGAVSSTPPLPRRPTRTDAAMSVRLIDHALEALETALATSPDLTWTAGFRYASFLEDARPLGLLLEDMPYRVLRLDVDLAEGAQRGQVLLALPAEGRGPRPAPFSRPSLDPAPGVMVWAGALRDAVQEAEVVLDAQVGRIRLPLAQAMALQVGMILPLGAARIDAVSLVGFEGKVVGQGRLGQNRGMRALRLADPFAGLAQIEGATGAAPQAARAVPGPESPANPSEANQVSTAMVRTG